MALALFFFGFIFVVSGIKGTQSQLASLFASEFSGAGNFWAFIVGIFFLGALGYYPPLRNTSRLLIGLVLVVLILSNGGFWQNLVAAVQNPARMAAPDEAPVPEPVDVKDAAKAIGATKGSVGSGNPADDDDLAAQDGNNHAGGRGDATVTTPKGEQLQGKAPSPFADIGLDGAAGLVGGIASAALGGFGGAVAGAVVSGALGGKSAKDTAKNVAEKAKDAVKSAADKATGGAFSGTIGRLF